MANNDIIRKQRQAEAPDHGQYYVGSTTSLIKRIGEHQQADSVLYRGAKFTKAHQPVELVYTEEYEDEHQARTDERSKSRDQACLGYALQGGGRR